MIEFSLHYQRGIVRRDRSTTVAQPWFVPGKDTCALVVIVDLPTLNPWHVREATSDDRRYRIYKHASPKNPIIGLD